MDSSSTLIYMNNVLMYKIDSLNYVYYYPQDTISFNWKVYKLDADSGDVWRVKGSPDGITARVENVFTALVFNTPSKVMEIVYYYQADNDTNFSSWYETRYLASGFGLVRVDAELIYPYVQGLAGCVIDGHSYGTLVSVENNLKQDKSFILLQNYPNPFNPVTTIKYTLPQNSQVTLEVYDILGEKVASLVNEVKSGGYHEAVFDGSNLSSGVYIYRLTASSLETGKQFVKSAKMVLVK